MAISPLDSDIAAPDGALAGRARENSTSSSFAPKSAIRQAAATKVAGTLERPHGG
ncbi:hypothetical protein Pres01_06290 [Metapseudomonas resinovorans]|nr:hypothetical protein Pres01_06290 [Pseudomonas resinovorans]